MKSVRRRRAGRASTASLQLAQVLDSPDGMAKPRKRQTGKLSALSAAPSETERPSIPGENGDYEERVAMRAYELYLARGGADGRDFDDWLAAERELTSHREGDARE
jgi:hypothetical protein